MTNHITDLQDQLSTLEDKGDPSPSRLAILQIAATLAVAQELRGIGNMMAWGAPDDIPPRIPASASPDYTIEIDEALSEVASVEMHDCTRQHKSTHAEICISCSDWRDCSDVVEL